MIFATPWSTASREARRARAFRRILALTDLLTGRVRWRRKAGLSDMSASLKLRARRGLALAKASSCRGAGLTIRPLARWMLRAS